MFAASATTKDIEVSPKPEDTCSSLCFSPAAELLAATSWDGHLRIWEISPNGGTSAKTAVQLGQQAATNPPILCSAWSPDGSKVFGGGASPNGVMLDMQSGQSIPFAQHESQISQCAIAGMNSPPQMQNMLVTGSYDRTIKFWDIRQNSTQPVHTASVPERVYAMDLVGRLMVVGTAERHILIYDLNDPSKPFKTLPSPLKNQTRVISCFPDQSGFAVGSTEGRVGIQYVENNRQSSNFSFKCHRQENNVYAINDISFHPTFGTFSTAGSDGLFYFWDKDSKQRLKTFTKMHMPIVATAFNRSGNIFAYAVGYDWSKGYEYHKQDQLMNEKIYLHSVANNEIEPKKKSAR